jgi:hypothetical protein
MKTILLLILFAGNAWAGNGSSSVGSADVPIIDGVAASLPIGFVKNFGNEVRDGDQPIISISSVERSELTGHWVPAHLGSVDGFEYVPEKGSAEKNSWAICGAQGCVRMNPLSDRNPKIPAVIGSLIRN